MQQAAERTPAVRSTRLRGHTGASERSGTSLRAAALSLSAGVTRWMHRRKPHGPRAERLQLDERGADDGGDAGVGQDAART